MRIQNPYSVGSSPTQGTEICRRGPRSFSHVRRGDAVDRGVSRATLRDWRDRRARTPYPSDCPLCANGKLPPSPYAHLLGLYLGDGCLSKHRRDVYALRIACDDAYPRLIDEAASAIADVHPSRPVHRVQAVGYTAVLSYWKHWPCLFPQHGAGPKHRRKIELAPGSRRSLPSTPNSSSAASSTLTAAESQTGPPAQSAARPSATTTPVTCSPTSPSTSCTSANGPWTY